MPRAPWRRRPTSDSPRPAGRRRGGVLARGVLLVRRSHRAAPVAVAPHPVPGAAALKPLVAAPSPSGASSAAPPAPSVAASRPSARVPAVRPRPAALPAAIGPAPAALPEAGEARPAWSVDGPGRGRPDDDDEGLLTGERSLARQVKFALANACTLSSLVLGVLAILLAMRGEVQFAALCVIACVVFDGLDGALARRLGVATPFGAQMDSLADMCSFGIAAPVVVYAWLAGSVPPAAAALACALVAACSAIRLARFNVCPNDGRFFSGVPTTMAAAVLALLVLIDLPLSAHAQLLGVSLLAFAMVTSFPYAKVGRLRRLPIWLWLVPLAGVVVNPQFTFAVTVGVYLASGPLLWLHHRRAA